VAEETEQVTEALDRLAAAVTQQVDLEAVARLAGSAAPLPTNRVPLPPRVTPEGTTVRVAVAAGEAFTFTYTDSLEALRAAGAEPVPFDPVHDERLPEGSVGLLAGGGFPEVHAAGLAANTPMLAAVRQHAAKGLPIWAECGGLLWLSQELDGMPMAGVAPAVGRMSERLTLGYRTAVALTSSPVAPEGGRLRGHEFHYSTVLASQNALKLSSRWGTSVDGCATPNLLATYLHVHPGGDPAPIERFARACAASAASALTEQE
jgi:cobyrinic acid a,c-diamide synthase